MKNLTLLTDLYQLTMMNGYFLTRRENEELIFDLYFRNNPSNGGYTIVCGIDQVIDYIENLSFSDSDISYLKSLKLFHPDFLAYLRGFQFNGDIYAVEEGSILFPNEPILRVKAKPMEAQLIETAMLNLVNFETLIATKASRVCRAAKDKPVMEFGLRRAQGPDAGVLGARAAIIGGCVGTSNVMTCKKYGGTPMGTHAHSWIQRFDTELEAFRTYAQLYPDSTVLLLDTYDTLRSGLPNALTVFRELRENGHEPRGVRIDSGDIEYLSRTIREELNAAGFENVKITASNDIDEYKILDLEAQEACVDVWGVGTRLITSYDWPSLGGVYKLSGVVKDGQVIPRMKISESPEKINHPGFKQIYRIFHATTGKAEADLITLDHETIDTSKPLTIFHPLHTWKKKTFTDFVVKKMLTPLFLGGKCVRKKKSIYEYREYVKESLDNFWPQHLRFHFPEPYKVDLSQELFDLKNRLLDENS